LQRKLVERFRYTDSAWKSKL